MNIINYIVLLKLLFTHKKMSKYEKQVIKTPNALLKKWYNLFSTALTALLGDHIRFLNYGFVDKSLNIKLPQNEIHELCCVNLYHYVATWNNKIKLKNKKILEVGCGRGGGSSYIEKTFQVQEIIGIDLAENNIKFCNNTYKDQNKLRFTVGNAENLPFPDNCFDVVINVESSHCYNNVGQFINEVKRVLRKGGYFLLADVRLPSAGYSDNIHSIIKKSDFKILEYIDITNKIIKGMETLTTDRKVLIEKYCPNFLKATMKRMVGLTSTYVYNDFKSGKGNYFYYSLRKK